MTGIVASGRARTRYSEPRAYGAYRRLDFLLPWSELTLSLRMEGRCRIAHITRENSRCDHNRGHDYWRQPWGSHALVSSNKQWVWR